MSETEKSKMETEITIRSVRNGYVVYAGGLERHHDPGDPWVFSNVNQLVTFMANNLRDTGD